ncbi:small integral membrane protein 26 [Tachyglossus aculeatus]|uniref:small integral membrane protein 26 n=1 Tax=Tachyglossus aculeatus TaxID=9261 RepID=UPI0018F34086|nr:small integral membrane protein 26 [Tachyglossus aculeatus]
MDGPRAVRWYRRMAVLYAMGAWTTLGSAFLLHWMRAQSQSQPQPAQTGDEEEGKEEHPPDIPDPRKGFYVETTFTYRENFVPYTTRIFNLLKSLTGGPGPAE